GYSDVLLFSTELQPSDDISELKKWWYIVPETGQHIALYNKVTFKEIAKILNVNYYTDSFSVHILSKKPLPADPFLQEETQMPVVPKKNILQRLISKIDRKVNKPEINQPVVPA